MYEKLKKYTKNINFSDENETIEYYIILKSLISASQAGFFLKYTILVKLYLKKYNYLNVHQYFIY